MPRSDHANDPQHWLDRAAKMRALAYTVADVETRTAMLKLAADYEKLAGRAEERADGRRPNQPKER